MRLKIVSEVELFQKRSRFFEPLYFGKNGSICEVLPDIHQPASFFSPAWSGRHGGSFTPATWSNNPVITCREVTICRVRHGYFLPKFGAVITPTGEVLFSTAAAFAFRGNWKETFGEIWSHRAEAKKIRNAAISLPWGAAIGNYGHFLLDGFSGISAILDSGDFRNFAFVTPPLSPRQKEQFDLIGINPRVLAEEIYRVRNLVFSNSMAYALHTPNLNFLSLRQRMMHESLSLDSAKMIYVSRRNIEKRRLQSEAALELALQKAGYRIVCPETMSAKEQIAVFAAADVIVGPTGAAFANVLYAKPGARIIEIIPRDMTVNHERHLWVAYLCALVKADWIPYFCDDAPGYERPVYSGAARPGFIPFDLDLAAFRHFLDSVVGA